MKNIRIYPIVLAVAALFSLSSCDRDDIIDNNNTGKVFTATIDNGEQTKTTINSERKVLWSVGDQISINGKVYTTESAGKTTTFVAVGDEAEGDTYTAFYPASLGSYPKFPPVQYYEEGSISNLPMFAYSNTTSLSFNNISAVIKLSLQASSTTVKKIEISSIYNEIYQNPLTGGISIWDGSVSFNPYGMDASNTVTLDCGDGVDISDSKDFYISIPDNVYKLRICVTDIEGNIWAKTMSDYQYMAANTIYPLAWNDMQFAQPLDPSLYVDFGMSAANGNRLVWIKEMKHGVTYESAQPSYEQTQLGYRLPKYHEFEELRLHCINSTTWSNQYSRPYGVVFRNPYDSSSSLTFLSRNNGQDSVEGYYWVAVEDWRSYPACRINLIDHKVESAEGGYLDEFSVVYVCELP